MPAKKPRVKVAYYVQDTKVEEYTESERVWAYSGPMLYEALVIKVQDKGGKKSYFVHYNKWSKKWDEWLDPNRMMKDTPESKAAAQKVKEALKAAQETKGAGAGGRKRKRDLKGEAGDEEDDTIEADEERFSHKEVSLKIPGQLKKHLVNDWELVTKEKLLVPLPRTPCVKQILEDFITSKTRNQDNLQLQREMVDGLLAYFNRVVSTMLLYRFERVQYEDLVLKEGKASEVYGAEHLARLFVKLPELLLHTHLATEERNLLQSRLSDLLKFLTKNTQFFTTAYVTPDKDYFAKDHEKLNAAAEQREPQKM